MAPELKNHWSGLFVGGRQTCSLGRVAFWIVFVLSIYFWLARPTSDFPSTLEHALMFLLAYNLGGKVINKMGRGKAPRSTPEAKPVHHVSPE